MPSPDASIGILVPNPFFFNFLLAFLGSLPKSIPVNDESSVVLVRFVSTLGRLGKLKLAVAGVIKPVVSFCEEAYDCNEVGASTRLPSKLLPVTVPTILVNI